MAKRWTREQKSWRYTIVSVDEARRLTGLEPDKLCFFGAEELVRTFADGRRERALRLPAEFVPSARGRESR